MAQAIERIGVVGCGLMGSGIAEVCARAGFTVVVREANADFLDKGMKRLNGSLDKAVARGKLTAAEREELRPRLIGTTEMSAFAQCDLIIEAVPENMELKKQIFTELDRIAPEHAVLASNTSSLAISTIAAITERPDKVIGMHFFNPVPVMGLVEIVRGLLTSDDTFETIRDLSAGPLGKQVVVAKDVPGFIVNLLLIPYLLDAVRVLEQGVGTKEDIDKGIVLGLNHPMGPFTLLDFVGLDTALFIADAMFEETKDSRFAAPTLLRRMVSAGLYGKKSGRGFYDYAAK